jgi:hypothetical protein
MTKLVNRAKMTTATTGTGTITLGSAVDGYQTFAAAGVADADVVRYVIEDGTAWEIGRGTYTASGTTLSRTVIESSNSNAALNLTGNAVVFVSATEADLREERVGSISTGTLNLATGNVFSDAPSANVTYAFSNPPASGTAYGFTLKVTPSATITLTWPASVKFPDGIAPAAPASGETAVYVFYTQDGGTTYFGFVAGEAMA